MTEKPKPLRQAMPWTTSIIDAWRQIPGSGIDDAIRNGMQGGSDFHAIENGHEIGSPYRPATMTAEPSTCRNCANRSRIGPGYCGGDRADLPPAYGPSHPLRQLPEDGGATCPNYLHYSEAIYEKS